jgi:hypothetical protein
VFYMNGFYIDSLALRFVLLLIFFCSIDFFHSDLLRVNFHSTNLLFISSCRSFEFWRGTR